MVSYVFRPDFDRRRWWLTLPVDVGGHATFDMVIDTESPLSGISEQVRDALLGTPHLQPEGRDTFRLSAVTIQRQPLPDLLVRISPRVTHLGAHGVLGLLFFAQFDDVLVNVPSLTLTLTRAGG